jgi:hypothetical protein
LICRRLFRAAPMPELTVPRRASTSLPILGQ